MRKYKKEFFTMNKIIFFDIQDYEKDCIRDFVEGKYDYSFVEAPLNNLYTPNDFEKNAEIISCFTTSRVTREVIDKFPNLKLIALRSVGFNHIDIEYAKEKGIAVENTPNYGNKTVAEFAFALLLDAARKVTRSYLDLKQSLINPMNTIGEELFDKTIGIVGLGAIGSEMARLAHGFGLKILGYDLYPKKELEQLYSVKYTDFDFLVQNSDIISLHSPLTKDNYHMFNEEVFNKMKPNSILINTARGELVDTQALYNALVNRKICAAGLDVLESEETLVDPDYLVDIGRMTTQSLQKTVLNNSILKLENVIVTPHIAYDSYEAINRILTTMMKNINSFIEGKIENNVWH